MKPRIAFLQTPDPKGFNEHIVEGLEKALSARNFETKVYHPTPDNIQEIVEDLNEFKPLFTFDINLDGVIFAESPEGEKKPLSDIVGNIHITWFLEDPMLHYSKLKPVFPSNQFLFLTIDIEHGQWLSGLGKNVAFVAPAINPSKSIPFSKEKEFEITFIGPVVDPVLFENAWKERLDESLYSYSVELGRLLFRNPEMPIRFASGFLASQYAQEFQEALLKFQQEKDSEFTALLAEIGGYAMSLRRWHIIESIDEKTINILGQVQGEMKDNVVVYDDVLTLEDTLKFISKSKISLLSQPPFLSSGLGLTAFYSVATGTFTMIEEKLASKSFFADGQEIITYNPIDSIDIEGKIIYYLEENETEREEIAKQGKDKVFKVHTLYQRGEIIGNILDSIIQQASKTDNNQGGQVDNS